MIRLSREIRFALASPEELTNQINHHEQKNSWSAWPNTSRIAPQLRLSVVVQGIPDSTTGYLCNVTLIDKALRRYVNDRLIPSIANSKIADLPDATTILRQSFEFLKTETFDTAELHNVKLSLSPFLGFEIKAGAPHMVQLTHQFEFSAAHRLHCDSMSSEENIAVFGKCNNPAGHGHNYIVEVTVSRNTESDKSDQVMPLGTLSEIVNRNVIDVLDHKNLNEDIEQFSKLNPSVENICSTIYGWLQDDIKTEGCILAEVKVFETPKTWASFRG